MKNILQTLDRALLAVILAWCFIATTLKPAYALDARELLSFFVSELTPYGKWSDVHPYGRVWEPAQQENWQPYSRGHWSNSEEYGWIWIPDDEWGEIPYRYGRWGYQNSKWFWVPDDTWGPAWVDWRQNDEYIGWAPLEPNSNWSRQNEWRPASSWNDNAQFAYVIVPKRHFTETNVRTHMLPRTQTAGVLGSTQNITVYRRVNQRVMNVGPAREVIERVIGRRIEKVQYKPRTIVGKKLSIPSKVRASLHPKRIETGENRKNMEPARGHKKIDRGESHEPQRGKGKGKNGKSKR